MGMTMKLLMRMPNQAVVRIIMVLSLSVGLFGLGRVVRAAGTTYYVSPSGNNNNSGTSSSSAWQTIAKVNDRTFNAGDSILFEGGQTFNGTLTFDNESGTSSSPITISSYGTGRATINGGDGTGIYLHNVGGFKVTTINVVGNGGTDDTKSGILFKNDLSGDVKLEYVRIDHVEVSNFGGYGVKLEGTTGSSGYKDVRIEHVVAHDNADGGIATIADTTRVHQNVYIGHSEAYNNKGIAGLTRNSGNGIVLGRVDGGVIEYSTAHDNGGTDTASEGPVGIWAWDSNNVTIQYNESYNNHTSGSHDGGGFDLDFDTSNSVLQYNYSHGNDGAGYLLSDGDGDTAFTNNIVRYNVSQNDGRKNYRYGGLHIFGAIYNTELYNNTIFMGPGTDVQPAAASLYAWSGSNVHFRNNIFVTTSGTRLINNETPTGSGLKFQGNNYWPSGGSFQISWGNATYTSLSSFRSGATQEQNGGTNTGFNVDPKLFNAGNGGTIGFDNIDALGAQLTAYQLKSDSPMINAGLNLSSQFSVNPGSRDFSGIGTPQGSGYDIGAYEFGNLLSNPGFESGDLNSWTNWPSGGSVVASNMHSGSYAAKQTGSSAGIYRTVTGLSPNTTYTFRGWIKAGASGNSAYLYAKNCGTGCNGSSLTVSGTSYTFASLTFTTGATNTSAELGLWRNSGMGSGDVYADDFELVPVNPLGNPGGETGSLSPWTNWPSGGSVVSSNTRTGTYAFKQTGSNAGIYRTVTGLSPNTTYTFRAYIKAGASGNSAYLYAKNCGTDCNGSSLTVSGTSYTLASVTFTTGATNTSAELGLWRNSGMGSGDVYADDFELVKQ